MPNSLHDAVVAIVEDNEDNLFIAQDLIRRKLPVRACHGVPSGAELYALLEGLEAPPALILLDLQMPQQDGYAILIQLRAQPALAMTLVVALTANVMADDVARAEAAGFDGFIGKPINHRLFPEQVGRLLAGEQVWEP